MQRLETFSILKKYYKNNIFINLQLKNSKINPTEISGVTNRVYGILQNKNYIDYLINKLTNNDKIDLNILIILEIAIYEYKFLNKRPDVCVNSAVELSKNKAKYASKYINAILRKIAIIDEIKINFIKEEKNLEIKYSHPRWIVKMFMEQYPNDYEKILKSNTLKKDITVRKLNNFIDNNNFINIKIPTLDSSLYKYISKNIVQTIDFKKNNFIIQSIGSYLIGEYVGANKNDIVLDLCAAPGNKSMHISNKVKLVVANEINKSRYELLNRNILKYNISNIKTINVDAANYLEVKKKLLDEQLNIKYDKILLDVPCSGLGVLGSKPDIKYKMTKDEIINIIKLQKKILDTADKLLKTGGQIIYSTCTLNKYENEYLISEFMEKYGYLEIDNEVIKKKFENTSELGFTLKPNVLNSDGFYMIKLVKNEK